MLEELDIRNVAVAEHVHLRLDEGFIALTGETGAGKSLVVDALAMLLGGAADPTVVRAGAQRARIEGVFRVTDGSDGALGVPCRPVEEVLPFGIYTVPEIAMVGPTEEAARRDGIEVVTGVGRFADTARGQIIGDVRGMLKLVVERPSRRLIGAHLIGTGGTELIHQAQMAIQFEVPYTYFVRTVMNYPTLSRVYKLAAWDLLEKLGD